jgi:hypothetical protein
LRAATFLYGLRFSFAPSGLVPAGLVDPRLAPWAAFFRSFGAGLRMVCGFGVVTFGVITFGLPVMLINNQILPFRLPFMN